MSIPRRQFLAAAGGWLAATTVGRLDLSRVLNKPSPILDAHTHLSSPQLSRAVKRRWGNSPFVQSAQLEHGRDLVERLNSEGIERAWVLSSAYLWAGRGQARLGARDEEVNVEVERTHVEDENEFVLDQTREFPERLVPFLSVNPLAPYALEEIDRAADAGMKGLKLHLWNSLVDVREEADRKRMGEVLDRAVEHELPILVHAFNGQVPGYGERDARCWIEELIDPRPGLRVCFAHLGGAGGFAPPVQEVLATLVEAFGVESSDAGRVFVDLSAVLVSKNNLGLPPTTPETARRMGKLLKAFGMERVLWGSDNIPSALKLCRDAWPLGDEDWDVVAGQTGDSLWGE